MGLLICNPKEADVKLHMPQRNTTKKGLALPPESGTDGKSQVSGWDSAIVALQTDL
jgi:hypothetical protein